jgi:osmotically inducible protein OsmC
MKTHGSAVWQGGIKGGKGAISTKSGALKEYPYGFSSRFEGKAGTNPEGSSARHTPDASRWRCR